MSNLNLQPENDKRNYLSSKVWFETIQEEKQTWKQGDSVKARYFPGGKELRQLGYYEKIHQKIGLLFNSWSKRKKDGEKSFVQGLASNKSQKVDQWCRFVIEKRQEYAKGNVDSIEDEESKTLAKNWLELECNSTKTKIFILPQRTFVTKVIDECNANNAKNVIRPTANDYIRLFSIIFSEDCRGEIPLLLQGSKSMNREQLDARPGSEKDLWKKIYRKFVEPANEAKYPDAWNTEGAKANIPDHASYDPNDLQRINVFRKLKEADVTNLLKKWQVEVGSDYNHAMKRFQNDTGGGSTNFLHWKDRDPLAIREEKYTGQVDNSEHLTFIHMFDKELGFIYVKPKSSIPDNISMDDSSSSKKSTGRMTPTVAVGKLLVQKMENISEQSTARSKKLDEILPVIMSTLQQSQSSDMFTTPPARSNLATQLDIRNILNSNGKSTLEELEWASNYLSDKIEKVNVLIQNICKQIEHENKKKTKKEMKSLEKTLRNMEKTRDSFQQQHSLVFSWISQNITGDAQSSDFSDDDESIGSDE